MDARPKFLQGVFPFKGSGLEKPAPVGAGLRYTVPPDKRAQVIYLRAGNSSSELVYLSVCRDGWPMRLFPIGAKADTHVPLAVVEDLPPDTKVEVLLAAPAGTAGLVVLDIGLVEI